MRKWLSALWIHLREWGALVVGCGLIIGVGVVAGWREVDPVGWTSSRVLTLFPNGHCGFRPIWCLGHRLRADRVSVRHLGHAPTRPPGRNPSLVSGPNDEFATLGA